jgi:hypothetical protein
MKRLERYKVFLNPKTKEEMKMAEVKMPHPGHEHHLCYLQNVGYLQDIGCVSLKSCRKTHTLSGRSEAA